MIHLIDDDTTVHKLVGMYLAGKNQEACCFRSGDEYLRSTEFIKPSIILSDIVMPGISGPDLVLEIRKQLPFQKIALISSYTHFGRAHAADNQLCYILEKPLRMGAFVAMINALIACEDAQKSEDPSEYFLMCEFGLNHTCPFHESKRLQLA
ncbi:MAG: response regulator [Mariprofundaceae bacterium]|nr:response regulator [Mariprofundaceae bacterium]